MHLIAFPSFCSLLQDVTNTFPSICEESLSYKDVPANWGQSLHLPCTGSKLNDIESLVNEHGPLKWFHYRTAKSSGFEVLPRRDKFIVTRDSGLVIMGITDRESGRYECKLGSNTISKYNISVDASKYNDILDGYFLLSS